MGEKDLLALFEMQAELCRALGHSIRLQILDCLDAKPTANSDLLEKLKIPKANLSQHIGVLEKAGIVVVEKKGNATIISLAMPEVKKACNSVRQMLQQHLRRELERKSMFEKILSKQSAK